MAEGTNSKQLLNQHGSIKVICNECGRAKEMEAGRIVLQPSDAHRNALASFEIKADQLAAI